MSLEDELLGLAPELKAELTRFGFDPAALPRIVASAGTLETQRVSGSVCALDDGELLRLPEPGTARFDDLSRRGLAALAAGEVAIVVLAGGMATRMGGLVKALAEALPGHTFLDLQLAARSALAARTGGRAAPLWLMTSPATDAAVERALLERRLDDGVRSFKQRAALRLTPDGTALFRDAHGQPSVYAPGHGDLLDALRDSGLLASFVQRGGRLVMVANIDNLGATLDPALVGLHLEHGAPVSCEVVDKVGPDRGGIPVSWNGRGVVLEEFRLPVDFDANSVRVFNTNTFLFDAAPLLETHGDLTWFRVNKQVDGAPALQLERLAGELTSFLTTRFVHVPRTGERSRFLPNKSLEELEARRAEIELVARARGMFGDGSRL